MHSNIQGDEINPLTWIQIHIVWSISNGKHKDVLTIRVPWISEFWNLDKRKKYNLSYFEKNKKKKWRSIVHRQHSLFARSRSLWKRKKRIEKFISKSTSELAPSPRDFFCFYHVISLKRTWDYSFFLSLFSIKRIYIGILCKIINIGKKEKVEWRPQAGASLSLLLLSVLVIKLAALDVQV